MRSNTEVRWFRSWKGWLWVWAVLALTLRAEVVVPIEGPWRYFKGIQEASTPREAWRGIPFDDSSWPLAPGPFYYGEDVPGGTRIDDMRYAYTTLFFRRTFTLTGVEKVGSVTLRIAVDDGFVVWLNGVEIARERVSPADPAYDDTANSTAREPVEFSSYVVPNQNGLLREGLNVLAVQVFNRSLTGSDIQFHAELSTALIDREPPRVVAVEPPPGPVAELTEITVVFSEAVRGVEAEDLRINDLPATGLVISGTRYTFRFPQPPYGAVEVRWTSEHGITDLGVPPNPLEPGDGGVIGTYQLSDSLPPRVVEVRPPPGSRLRQLSEIEVLFSEPVTGVDAADLLIGGRPATQVVGVLDGPYRFQFDPAEAGSVEVRWAAEHGIADRNESPNQFAGAAWTYQVDPAATPGKVVLSELLAQNLSGLRDEDGAPQDWIELENRGAAAVSLEGWSLTDDPDMPGKWVFPAVVLQPGERLVVFASGKDRRHPGAALHTNFKLGVAGEYLGLFNHEQPREAIAELAPAYPEQRNDISYGLAADGSWRYFAQPTPGAPNTGSTLAGVTPEVKFSVKRGFYDAPFDLELSCQSPEAQIRYTLDGAPPTATTGTRYTGPIRIDRTRVVRAVAVAPGLLPSRVKTHSYFFVEDIVHQPALPEGFPAQWGSRVVTTGDYEMDPRIVEDPRYSQRVRDGLRSLPALSLVMSIEDWFSPDRGIYSNGDREGIAWERTGSLELVTADGRESVQEDCGLRIQGGSSTNPWKSYKLSMQARFRSDYGAAWFEHRLFKDSAADRFDTLIIDAGLNYVWTYGGGVSPTDQRGRAKYLTDQFASDLQLACGGMAVHGRFVNVFINGVYWGLHNLHEEPEAAFGATYIGGDKDEYDVIKHTGSNVLDGNRAAWDQMMTLARRDLSEPANYEALAAMLDIPAFIDYMLVHFYIGDTDWPHHNWYALRRRVPDAKWYFVSWDSEHSLKSVNENRTGVTNANTCAEIYNRLRANPEFRLLFADRVQRHFFNGGVYYVNPQSPAWDPAHPENNRPAALYNRRVAEIDTALVAESARWGDNQRPSRPYTRDTEYEETLRWLNETYFPQRSGIVLEQLRSAGLYPNVTAPSFSRHGGVVPAGYQLILSSPAGEIWFTTDGTDPRQPGSGAVAPSARRYDGKPLVVDHPFWLRARVLARGEWSALVEATFSVGAAALTVLPTEIMYNAAGGGEYEFLELVNLAEWPVDLSGHRLAGIDYLFPPGSVARPGQPILLVSDRNPTAFAARYPGVIPDGFYPGTLADRGEAIQLETPEGRILWRVAYDDRGVWPALADGEGRSLELRRPEGDLSEPASWTESRELGGSPGRWTGPPASAAIRLNEVFAAGATAADPDYVELFNAGPDSVDLAGWQLVDDNGEPWTFPPGSRLGAGEWRVVWCGGTPPDGAAWQAPFALDRQGESVALRDPEGHTVDALSFGPQLPGRSLGLVEGDWVLTLASPGTANTAAPVASARSLRINELFPNPLPGEDDWVEVYNPASLPVPMRGLTWVQAEESMQVRTLGFIPAEGYTLWRADDRNGPGHLLLRLPASGGELRLETAEGTLIDSVAWPALDENVSWGRFPDGSTQIGQLAAVTPGAPNSDDPTASDRDQDGLPDVWESAHGLDPGSAKGDDGPHGDPDGDGLDNLAEWQAGTDPLTPDGPLRLQVTLEQTGQVTLRFRLTKGRTYRVEYRDQLDAGEWREWTVLGPASADRDAALTVPEVTLSRARFYRLVGF